MTALAACSLTETPPFADWLRRIAAAETGDGWLVECADRGQMLALSEEFVQSLVEQMHVAARGGTVLEVCAGDGALAAALRRHGVDTVAIDADPPAKSDVVRLTAAEALARFEPRVVLAAFAPIDSGVARAVLAAPSVRECIVLGATIGGQSMAEPWLRAAAMDSAEWVNAEECATDQSALSGRSVPGHEQCQTVPVCHWLCQCQNSANQDNTGGASGTRRAAGGWHPHRLPAVERWMLTRHDVWLGDAAPLLQHGEAFHFVRSSATGFASAGPL
ncbi:MAG: hypothetical protein ACOY3P_16460 [Planctomycetota bacterium]